MSPPLRILLIDDQPDDRVLMQRELGREFPDLQIEEVADAPGLSQALGKGDFDLAIAACQLPWTDGLSVLRSLKTGRPEWQVILLIDPENEEVAKEAMKNGLDDYVIKSPRHFFHLAATIHSTWGKIQGRRAIRQAEELYLRLFDDIPVGLYRITPEGRIIYANPAVAELLGFSNPEAVMAHKATDFYVNPENRKRWQALVRDEGVVRGFEVRLRRRDGKSVWVRNNARAIRDEQGRVLYYEGSLEEISAYKDDQEALQKAKEELEMRVEERTAALRIANENLQSEIEERTRAEKALRAAEAQFRSLVEQSLVGIYILQDDLLRYVNPKLAELFAYTQEEITNRSPRDLVVPEDWPMVAENIRKRMAGEIESLRYHFRGCKKDGAQINVEVHSTITEFQGRPAIMGTLRDITQLTRAFEALGRRDAILEAVSFAAAGFMKTIDWQKNIPEVLERLGQATGVIRVCVFENYQDDSGALRARRFCEWASPENAPEWNNPKANDFSWKTAGMENWAATLSQGLPVWGCVRKSSQKASIIDVPISVGGQWWGIIGFEDSLGEREWSGEEIEALKAAAGIIGGAIQRDDAQKALQRQQNLLKTIFHTIPDLIILKDPDLVHCAVNPALCRFLGRMEEDILGKKDSDLFPATEAEIYRREELRVMESGQPFMKDEEVTGAQGKQWLQVLKTPVLDEEGAMAGILCSFRDISARKKAEETLRDYRARLQTIIAERTAGEPDQL